MAELLLRVTGVSKSFPGVKALDNVNLEIEKGEIHGLIGENGAGKSTIIKIIAGIYPHDEGTIHFMGQECTKDNIQKSLALGISVIYQELCLVPYMKVYENIMLGSECGKKGFYSGSTSRNKAKEIVESLGLNLPLDVLVKDLDIAEQQMVEIAKAFSRDVKLIIMDEPTSSLTHKEISQLYNIVRNLKTKGVSTLFVSHKLDEIREICDRITVFRDGHTIISNQSVKDITEDDMVHAMVGREITNYYSSTHVPSEETIFQVNNIGNDSNVSNVSFSLHKGEVLGVTGLIGAGRTETAHIIFGLDHYTRGEMLLNGKKVSFKSPAEAVNAGIALVPENRKEQGIIPQMGVEYNISITALKEFIHFIHVNAARENEIVDNFFNSLRIKAYSKDQKISNLSGGNQQKAILARWLVSKPSILILDEPTRGIDIGAKKEIYEIIDNLAKQGISIILISSELPEIINMSDRILIMKDKKSVTVLEDKKDFEQETIMKFAL